MLSALLEHRSIAAFDGAADRALDHLRGRRWSDRLFYAASEAANHSLLWHAIAWGRAAMYPDRRREAAQISLALGVESALVNGPIKMLFRRSRPDHAAKRPHRLRVPKTSSFPSGHATSATCAAILLSRRSSARPLWIAIASVVAVSRAHVRIHHASDVIGGVVVGTVLGTGARKLLDRR